MADFAKLQEEIDKAEKILDKAKNELAIFYTNKKLAPQEVIDEMNRMIKCDDWGKWAEHPPDHLGEIMVKNIFREREREHQQWKDQQRDY